LRAIGRLGSKTWHARARRRFYGEETDKRHGTTTLFASFEEATGKVKARHAKQWRREEFLDFMDDVVAAYPKTRLEVILDNLSTHRRTTNGSRAFRS
jgi:DDE superfamily endonuclease